MPAKTLAEKLKALVFQFVGALFMEKKGNVWALSKGAVSFWIVFGHALYIWATTDHDITQGELYTLWALLGYAGFKVGAQTVTGMKNPAAALPADVATSKFD